MGLANSSETITDVAILFLVTGFICFIDEI